MSFTLIEVLLTISIVAILTLMASPQFNSCYYSLKEKVVVEQVKQEIALARSEAIRNQQTVSYCSGFDAGNWQFKRLVKDKKGKTLYNFFPLPKDFQLLLRNSLGKNSCLTFTSLGFTQGEWGSFYLITPHNVARLVISLSGRVRVIPDAVPYSRVKKNSSMF